MLFRSASANIAVSMPALSYALNCIADKNAVVTLLADMTITPTEVLNRGFTLVLEGNNKTLTSGTNGLTVCSGDITIKNLTINASTAAPDEGKTGAYALRIAKTVPSEDNAKDSYTLKLVVTGCALNAYVPVQDNPFLSGSVNVSSSTGNGTNLEIAHTYTAPTPIPPSMMEDDEDAGIEEPSGPVIDNTPDAPAGDAPAETQPATTAPADTQSGGCKGAIGIGAIAIVAAAGLACGFTAKKKED